MSASPAEAILVMLQRDAAPVAKVTDGRFAFVVLRDRRGRLHLGMARHEGDHSEALGTGSGTGSLWCNTESDDVQELGVIGIGGAAESAYVRIEFLAEHFEVPVVDGYFAWMRPETPPHSDWTLAGS